MIGAKFTRRVQRSVAYRMHHYVLPYFSGFYFAIINRVTTSPLVQPGGPEISMTTYGDRIRTVYITLESIAAGSLLPSSVVLWLDDERLFRNLPRTLERLKKRGLQIRLTSNYGPHTKYYPYIEASPVFDSPLVIADDDQLYGRSWLKKLADAYREHPNVVNCHAAHTMRIDEQGIHPYMTWMRCGSPTPSFRQMALGVSGVIYPPEFLKKVKESGTAFMSVCPKADDLWLHLQALRTGWKVRQLAARHREHMDIPGTQRVALWRENDYGNRNDEQIALAYREDDIQKLLDEQQV